MFGIIALGAILMILTMTSGLTPDQSECTDCGAVGSFIGLSYILLFVAIIAVLVGAVMQAVMNPAKMKGTLIGVGAMLAVLVLSYVLADGTVEPSHGNITESTSRFTGAGLYAFYILFILAVGSIGYSSISRLIK